MKTLTATAQNTLRVAIRTRSSKASNVSKRLKIIAPILCIALLATLGTSVCIAFIGIENAGASKALLSINILSTLLTIASVYALCGVFWNAYWLERGTRVDAESELREVVDSMPVFLQAACNEFPKFEKFNVLVAENKMEMNNGPQVYFGIAASLINDEAFVARVQNEVRKSVYEPELFTTTGVDSTSGQPEQGKS